MLVVNKTLCRYLNCYLQAIHFMAIIIINWDPDRWHVCISPSSESQITLPQLNKCVYCPSLLLCETHTQHDTTQNKESLHSCDTQSFMKEYDFDEWWSSEQRECGAQTKQNFKYLYTYMSNYRILFPLLLYLLFPHILILLFSALISLSCFTFSFSSPSVSPISSSATLYVQSKRNSGVD